MWCVARVTCLVPVFCPGFQKGRVPSEKGTLASKGHFSAVNGPSKGQLSTVN